MNEILNNKKRSEVLAEKLMEMNYGDIIKHEQIAEVINVNYPSNAYTTTIAKVRKILLKKGRCLENIVGDGYRILQPDSFVQHSLKHYKRGFNEMKKGYETLINAPTKNMTTEGRNIYRRVYDRAITLDAAMKGASVELKMLGKRNHPMEVDNINRYE
mgnify:CR=1 FL=1